MTSLWPIVTSMNATNALVQEARNKLHRINSIVKTWNRDKTGRLKEATKFLDGNSEDESAHATAGSVNGISKRVKDFTKAQKNTFQPTKLRRNLKQLQSSEHQTVVKSDSDDDPRDRGYVQNSKVCDTIKHENRGFQPSCSSLSLFEKEQADSHTNLKDLPFKTPGPMKEHCQLKQHQKYGFNYLNMLRFLGIPAILADDMGLGKTCTVIALIACMAEHDNLSDNAKWPSLIVVPPTTLDNWQKEFGRFAPSLRVMVYRGMIWLSGCPVINSHWLSIFIS